MIDTDPKTIRLRDVEVEEIVFEMKFDTGMVGNLYDKLHSTFDWEVFAFALERKPVPQPDTVEGRVEEHLMRMLEHKVRQEFGALSEHVEKEIRRDNYGVPYGFARIFIVKDIP